MTNKQRQNYLTLHKKTDIESNISCPSVMPIFSIFHSMILLQFSFSRSFRASKPDHTRSTADSFHQCQRNMNLKKVVRDDIMKVIRKFSFHLFRDLSPSTLPFLLSRRFPFAFTFLGVLLWVWRLKYITKTTQAWDNIIQNMQSSLISN